MRKDEEINCINIFKNANPKKREEEFNKMIVNILSMKIKEGMNQEFAHFKSS